MSPGSLDGGEALHPRVAAAARGELPPWAVAGPARRAHMDRVHRLVGEWAEADPVLGERATILRASAWLHDALRDADQGELRSVVAPGLRELPDPLLHGPAAAARLRDDGVRDRELLRAVTYHTTGHPGLGPGGRALYLADFLESGRDFLPGWRGELRSRMPGEREEVLVEVVRARIAHLLERGKTVRGETLAFWNALVEG